MTDYSFDIPGMAGAATADDACDSRGRATDRTPLPMRRTHGKPVRDDLLGALLSAVSAADEDSVRRDRALAEMRAAGLSDADIADLYVPEIARRFGDRWSYGGESMVDVTIVTARLQSLLRDLGARQRPDPFKTAMAPCVAVVVMADEAHTLGAMVFSTQLRRLGVSVRQIVGQSDSAIIDQIVDHDVDAVMISVARTDGVASLAKLVKKLRRVMCPSTPIVAGGAVLARERDLKKKTGVDHIATDPKDALTACGVTASRIGARAVPA